MFSVPNCQVKIQFWHKSILFYLPMFVIIYESLTLMLIILCEKLTLEVPSKLTNK
jgi:hypothetical protein